MGREEVFPAGKLNQTKFNKKLDPGRCFGMVLDWAHTSLKLKGVNALDQLTEFKWNIRQSAFEQTVDRSKPNYIAKQREKIIESSGLRIVNNNGALAWFQIANFNALAADFSNLPGTHIIEIWANDAANLAPHFMGFRCDTDELANTTIDYFDPNVNLSRWQAKYNVKKEFARDVAGLLTQSYPQHTHYLALCTVELAR